MRRIACIVFSVGIDILPKQREVANTPFKPFPAFRKNGRSRAGFLASSGIGHNAVGAKVVTALHDIDKSPCIVSFCAFFNGSGG